MQGILTRRYGTHRIRASCDAKSIIITKDDALNYEKQHRAAAQLLARELGWWGTWYGADVPGVKGMVWVRVRPEISDSTFQVRRRKKVP